MDSNSVWAIKKLNCRHHLKTMSGSDSIDEKHQAGGRLIGTTFHRKLLTEALGRVALDLSDTADIGLQTQTEQIPRKRPRELGR